MFIKKLRKKLIACKKSFAVMGVVMLLIGAMPTSAFAANTVVNIKVAPADLTAFGEVDTLLRGDTTAGTDLLNMDMKVSTSKTAEAKADLYKWSSPNIVFDVTAFANATDKSRTKALEKFVTYIQKSDVSEQCQQDIFNQMSDSSQPLSVVLVPMMMTSTKADMFTAFKWLSPFLPTIKTLFGIGAFIIVFVLSASTIADLVFIGLPFARESMSEKGDKAKGGRIPFISSEAQSVISETEGDLGKGGKYRNAYLLYFRRRALTYIILALCLLYLVAGAIGSVISWLLGLASGVVG